MVDHNSKSNRYNETATEEFRTTHYAILRTVFETEAETLILPLAFDLTEKAETRILPLVIENCPDYCTMNNLTIVVYAIYLNIRGK